MLAKPKSMKQLVEKSVRLQAGRRPRAVAAVEDLVTPEARRHGAYGASSLSVTAGELSGVAPGKHKVVLNRGGTAIDRWILSERKLEDGQHRHFEAPAIAAIERCRTLWMAAEGLGSSWAIERVDVANDDGGGFAQAEALATLADYKDRLGARLRPYWEVFENVVRFDQDAGVAGSSIAGNKRSAIDQAKVVVAFVANLIAMWEGL